MTSAGKKFREALKASSPLQIVGTINAYQALQATKTEFINGKYGEEYKKPFYWAPYVYIGI